MIGYMEAYPPKCATARTRESHSRPGVSQIHRLPARGVRSRS